jgi:hypothetical protein
MVSAALEGPGLMILIRSYEEKICSALITVQVKRGVAYGEVLFLTDT